MKKYYKAFGILIILLVVLFVSYRYGDLKYVLFYEYAFFENIINHNDVGFYTYCMQQYELYGFEAGASFALWGMPMYVILGIWGIPIFLASELTNLSIYDLMDNIFIVVYGKAVLLIFLVLAVIITIKIVNKIGESSISKMEVILVLLSSYFIIAPVFIQGQTDIIEIFFMLLGTYCILNKKQWMAVFVFMISVSLKQISLLYFIPILLVMEKKILKIIPKIGIVLGFTVLNKIIFNPFDLNYSESNISIILSNKLPILQGDIPIFLAIYTCICVFAYFYNSKDEKAKMRTAVLIGIIIYGSMCLFSNQIYRCIYVAPFLVMAISMVKREQVAIVIAIETLIEGCYALYQICKYAWCFEITNSNYMLPSIIFGKLPEGKNLIQVSEITKVFSAMYLDVLAGCLIIALLFLIGYYLIKKDSRKLYMPFIDKISIERAIYIRIFIAGLIGCMPIIIYVLNILIRKH